MIVLAQESILSFVIVLSKIIMLFHLKLWEKM